MVKKAVDAEAKSALQPRSSTKEMDQNCPRGSRPANSTVAKSQGSAMKDPQTEEPKVRGTESASGPPQRSNNNEFSDKARKKRRRNDVKRIENVKKALPRLPELTQLIPVNLKRRKTKVVWTGHHVTLVRSSAITVRKWVTMPTDVRSQKTSFSLGDLLVGD